MEKDGAVIYGGNCIASSQCNFDSFNQNWNAIQQSFLLFQTNLLDYRCCSFDFCNSPNAFNSAVFERFSFKIGFISLISILFSLSVF